MSERAEAAINDGSDLAVIEPLTEAKVTALLRDRHANPGNGGGGEWAFMAQARNAAGFDNRSGR